MRAIKYVSWGDTTGYAVAAKSYIHAFLQAGVELTWTPMMPAPGGYAVCESTDWPCPVLGPVCNRPLDYDTVVIQTVPEYYPAWIESERAKQKRVIGYTVWELECLPDHWPAILNQLDAVIVPCHWNREVFIRSGVTVPVHVVPHLPQFSSETRSSDKDRNVIDQYLSAVPDHRERFVFYNVAFWSNRKAPYLSLQAYWRAFSEKDNTLMVLKTSAKDITRYYRHWRNGFRGRQPTTAYTVEQLRKQCSGKAPVVLIADEDLSDGQMLALHERGDCFVSLTRTEGWGLGAFEASRMSKPVIMTAYGGQLDFLDRDLSYLVDYEMVPVHEPTWSANYRDTDQWASPSIEQAASMMREVYENQSSAKARAHEQARRNAARFSADVVVRQYLQALDSKG